MPTLGFQPLNQFFDILLLLHLELAHATISYCVQQCVRFSSLCLIPMQMKAKHRLAKALYTIFLTDTEALQLSVS